MQQDTRRLNVAYDHLRTALTEVSSSLDQTDLVMAQAAATRALSHLDLIWRRLEQERERDHGRDGKQRLDRAYNASRLAWQGLHDSLNVWPRRRNAILEQVRSDLLDAIDSLEPSIARPTTPTDATEPELTPADHQ